MRTHGTSELTHIRKQTKSAARGKQQDGELPCSGQMRPYPPIDSDAYAVMLGFERAVVWTVPQKRDRKKAPPAVESKLQLEVFVMPIAMYANDI